MLLGPAQHLVERGHRVAFFAARDLAEPLAAAALPSVLTFTGRAPLHDQNRGAALAALLGDAERRERWIRALLLDGVEDDLAALDGAIRSFRPQVIACDPMVYAAPIAAERASLPWLALSASLNPVLPEALDSALLGAVRRLACARDALFARHHLRATFSGCDCLSPHGTLVFASEAFVGAPPRGVELVGPSRPRDRVGAEPHPSPEESVPLVYASLGSQNWHQPTWVRTILDAVRDRPVRLLLAAGGLAAEVRDVPPNARVVAYADQRAVLAAARVFVTHGGANSVIEGLDAGVPLLVTPFVNDQPHNAWFVGRAGAGRVVAPLALTSELAWAEIAALLDEGPVRRNAARVRDSFQALDGARTAATRIEEAIA